MLPRIFQNATTIHHHHASHTSIYSHSHAVDHWSLSHIHIMPTPLQKSVQIALSEFIKGSEGENDAIDVLRTFQQEATLLYEGRNCIDLLKQDPFEHLEGVQPQVKRLCSILQVTDSHRVVTKNGYSYMDAVVRLPADAAMHTVGVTDNVQLVFRYERQTTINPAPNDGDAAAENTVVTYSIDLSRDHGPNERLLWVQVFANGSTPSALPAQNLEEEMGCDEDDWEDMEEEKDEEDAADLEDAQEETNPVSTGSANGQAPTKDAQDCDRFAAGMDPDALTRFLQWSCLGPMDEATAFFLLMTFPFYEHEWDLVSYILDGVFGYEKDDSDNDNSDNEEEAEAVDMDDL